MVKFEQADQIINFVRIINRYAYDADVKCGSRVVDMPGTTNRQESDTK